MKLMSRSIRLTLVLATLLSVSDMRGAMVITAQTPAKSKAKSNSLYLPGSGRARRIMGSARRRGFGWRRHHHRGHRLRRLAGEPEFLRSHWPRTATHRRMANSLIGRFRAGTANVFQVSNSTRLCAIRN